MEAVIERHKPRTRAAAVISASAASSAHQTTPAQLVEPGSRVVVIAPHPDDEVLALGATLASLSAAGHEVVIVAVTDGEASHPGSHQWSPETLRMVRAKESLQALRRLGMAPEIIRLSLPDGQVPLHEKRLAELLPLGSNDTVFVPWRHDGHPDHEACARAALAACRTVSAKCIEFPVWALVPTHPAHARLQHRRLQRVVVPEAWREAKRSATAAYSSQIHPEQDTEAVLTATALAAWQGPYEWVIG